MVSYRVLGNSIELSIHLKILPGTLVFDLVQAKTFARLSLPDCIGNILWARTCSFGLDALIFCSVLYVLHLVGT